MPNYLTCKEATSALAAADRVLVVACSGGGKTTLSRQIAAIFGMEYLSIDRDVRYLAGWQARDKQKQRDIITQLLPGDRWVMDGSQPSSFDLRLPRADLLLWVRVPRYMALSGLALRVMRYFGSVRPHMAAGCPEALPDRELLSYAWNFEKNTAPRFIREIELHGPLVPVVVLKSRRQIDEFLARSQGA